MLDPSEVVRTLPHTPSLSTKGFPYVVEGVKSRCGSSVSNPLNGVSYSYIGNPNPGLNKKFKNLNTTIRVGRGLELWSESKDLVFTCALAWNYAMLFDFLGIKTNWSFNVLSENNVDIVDLIEEYILSGLDVRIQAHSETDLDEMLVLPHIGGIHDLSLLRYVD